MIIQNALIKGSNILKKNRINSFLLDSEILMSKAIKKNREYILLNPKKNLKKKSLDFYKSLINKRKKGKPIAYLVGKKNHYNGKFFYKKI